MKKLMKNFKITKTFGLGYAIGWGITIIVYTIIVIAAGAGNSTCLKLLTKFNNQVKKTLNLISMPIMCMAGIVKHIDE